MEFFKIDKNSKFTSRNIILYNNLFNLYLSFPSHFQFWYDFQEITDQILTNGTIKGNLTQLISDIIMEIDTEKKNIELKKFKLLKAKYDFNCQHIFLIFFLIFFLPSLTNINLTKIKYRFHSFHSFFLIN